MDCWKLTLRVNSEICIELEQFTQSYVRSNCVSYALLVKLTVYIISQKSFRIEHVINVL